MDNIPYRKSEFYKQDFRKENDFYRFFKLSLKGLTNNIVTRFLLVYAIASIVPSSPIFLLLWLLAPSVAAICLTIGLIIAQILIFVICISEDAWSSKSTTPTFIIHARNYISKGSFQFKNE